MTNALGAVGRSKIVDFVQSGGLYVGTCAGWYYASPAYFWEFGSTWPDAGYWAYPNLLGLFPVAVEGSIVAIQDMELAPNNWHGNATTNISVLRTKPRARWGIHLHRALYYVSTHRPEGRCRPAALC